MIHACIGKNMCGSCYKLLWLGAICRDIYRLNKFLSSHNKSPSHQTESSNLRISNWGPVPVRPHEQWQCACWPVNSWIACYGLRTLHSISMGRVWYMDPIHEWLIFYGINGSVNLRPWIPWILCFRGGSWFWAIGHASKPSMLHLVREDCWRLFCLLWLSRSRCTQNPGNLWKFDEICWVALNICWKEPLQIFTLWD